MEPLWGQSILSSAGYTWRKVSVDRDAVYKIDYNQLKSMGFNPDGVDPRKIQLFTGWNGMLLQKNSTQSNDLAEVAIFIEGESDGKFNSGD